VNEFPAVTAHQAATAPYVKGFTVVEVRC